MALVKCPECKKKISNSASTCPNCGFPVGEYDFQPALVQMEKRQNRLKNVLKKLCVILVSTFALILIANIITEFIHFYC